MKQFQIIKNLFFEEKKDSKDDSASNVMYDVKHADPKTEKNSRVDFRASFLYP